MTDRKRTGKQRGKRPSRRQRRRRNAVLIAAALALGVAVVVSLLLIIPGLGSRQARSAAIVDQLSLTFPNPSFAQQATALLVRAGYVVDYYPGEEVTVDFFRALPDRGYDYLILRVHSTAVLREAGGASSTENAVLFTGEPHDPAKHVEEQAGRYLARTHYAGDEESHYFGIVPSFVRSRMEGSFEGATVILLGCEGLSSDTAASAFVDRGAGTVIGWDGPVSASHTDAAAERLLRHLLVDLESADEAVTAVMAEVGPDPTHGSRLLVYPSGG